jgi:hypothetical protein
VKNERFTAVFAFAFAFCAAACSLAPTLKAFRWGGYSPIPDQPGSALKADVNNRVSAVVPISPQMQLLNGSSINVMAPPYNAKCDGVTDDTVAIQEASIAAFATHVALLIPSHCVVSQLNWTNYNAHSGKYIDVIGYNGDNTTNTQSALICRETVYDTGVCVDMTGAEYATIQHVAISSSGAGFAGTCAASKTCPPKVSLLLATKKFVPTQNSNVIDLEGVYVDNVGGGDYSVYDYGGEVFHATHYYFHGGNVAALLLSNNNSAGIASPFLGALPAPPISMTSVRLLHGVLDTHSASSWVVLLDPGRYQMSDITIDGGYANTAGVGSGFIGDMSGGGSIHNLTVNNIRYESGGNTAAVFAKFANQVEGVQMTNDIFAPGNFTPMGAIVQFNDAAAVSVAGGNISIRPADGQGSFFNTIVSCISSVGLTISDIDATGGAPTHNNCPGAVEFYQGAIMTKLAAAPGAALGAGHCEMFTVAGTKAGTCKIQAVCGTSTTPVLIMDNIGSGC